jgi:MoaA/NifB/PqqE/SkfB family radical SAM enzyme
METKVNFYKEDNYPEELWLNKEYLVQLNLTGECPLNCEFCYMDKHKKEYLQLEEIKKLWQNLRKHAKEQDIDYRVNITGGDIFKHPDWKNIAKYIATENTIAAIDPLINRFWKKEHLELLTILKDKINFVQLNPEVVTEEDIIAVRDINKKVVLKIALYKGDTKKNIDKIKILSEKFDNIIVSIDLIIPQKKNNTKKEDYLIFNIPELNNEVSKLKEIFGEKIWLLSTTIKREYLKQIYYCPVPFGGVYVMPNGAIVPCSRYSHLDTGFNINNFDLLEYINKFNKLCSNFCLCENKYFKDFWKDNDNPINFGGK